jgi:hypothetical protein
LGRFIALLASTALAVAAIAVVTLVALPGTGEALYRFDDLLPPSGIELCEIPRLSVGDSEISASAVRAHLKSHALEELRPLVPLTTFHELKRMVQP